MRLTARETTCAQRFGFSVCSALFRPLDCRRTRESPAPRCACFTHLEVQITAGRHLRDGMETKTKLGVLHSINVLREVPVDLVEELAVAIRVVGRVWTRGIFAIGDNAVVYC